MTKRYLNLLPDQYKFDIRKYAAIKIFTAFLIANLIILVIFFSIDKYNQMSLVKLKAEKEQKLQQVQKLNQSILVYETEKNRLESIIQQLNTTEKTYSSLFNTNISYLIDLSRTLDLITDGIFINSISYSNGTANITAVASNAKNFYHFYNNIEKRRDIKDKRFYNLTEVGNGAYSFSATLTFRGLNE